MSLASQRRIFFSFPMVINIYIVEAEKEGKENASISSHPRSQSYLYNPPTTQKENKYETRSITNSRGISIPMALTPKEPPIRPPPPSPGQMAQGLPGGLLQLDPALSRCLQSDNSHHLLHLLPARWSQPGHAPARKWEGEEVQGEEDIEVEVCAQAHLHPQARSSGHKTDHHWGRSPSALRPTWASPLRSTSRPPRPAHCAGSCQREGMDNNEGGRPTTANPRPGPARSAVEPES